MKPLSRIANDIPLSPIREMFDLAATLTDVVSFTLGEPDFDTPSHVVDAAIESLKQGETHYTANAGILPLREAISKHVEKSHGLTYNPEGEIIVTIGGTEALVLIMKTILDPGDEVIISDPCWTNYPTQLMMCHGKAVPVPVSAENSFVYTPEALEAAITDRTKAFILNSPANPTGGIASREALEKLAAVAIKHDLYVITDEVYSRILYDGNEAVSIATLPGMKERTLIVDSFSKTYAMTGWRVGYALGPNFIIKEMTKLQENLVACVNSSAQYGAIAALNESQQAFDDMLAVYDRRRRVILEEFQTVKGLKVFSPQGAFYAFIDVSGSGMDARTFALDLLAKAKVIVVPGNAFGEEGKKYVRLSFATSTAKIKEGIRRIRIYMDELLP